MGLRSFLGFESPHERETRLSLAAYEDCRWFRKETLRRFRPTAVLELLQEYADLELLIDIRAHHILGVSAPAGVLICGLFLDTVYPDIDFIPNEASNRERDAAVAEFQRKLSRWPYKEPERYVIIPQRINVFHPISDVCHRIEDEIATRGYIYEPVPLESVASLQIRKNGRLLGQTSPWGLTPLHDLINSIDLEVLLDCSGGPRGVSDITIDVGVLNYWDCDRAFRTARFKQIYMDKPRASPEINSRERKSISDATKAFVAAVYPFVNQKPSDLDELEEYTPGVNEDVREFLNEQLRQAS